MNSNKKSIPTRRVPPPVNQQVGSAGQFKPVVAQLKSGVPAQSLKRPVAPPVYRPQAKPRSYCPQPVTKALQTKRAVPLLVNTSVKRGGASVQLSEAKASAEKPGIKVGDVGASPIALAASHWDRDENVYAKVRGVLDDLRKKGIEFESVRQIVDEVNKDPQVKAAVAEAAAANVIVGRLADGQEVRERDIKGAEWRPLVGPGRRRGDYQLLVTLGEDDYSLHIHVPNRAREPAPPGQAMRKGRMTGHNVPLGLRDEIVRIKGRPAVWDEDPAAIARPVRDDAPAGVPAAAPAAAQVVAQVGGQGGGRGGGPGGGPGGGRGGGRGGGQGGGPGGGSWASRVARG